MGAPLHCIFCGTANGPGDRFCRLCRSPLGSLTEAAPPTPASARHSGVRSHAAAILIAAGMVLAASATAFAARGPLLDLAAHVVPQLVQAPSNAEPPVTARARRDRHAGACPCGHSHMRARKRARTGSCQGTGAGRVHAGGDAQGARPAGTHPEAGNAPDRGTAGPGVGTGSGRDAGTGTGPGGDRGAGSGDAGSHPRGNLVDRSAGAGTDRTATRRGGRGPGQPPLSRGHPLRQHSPPGSASDAQNTSAHHGARSTANSASARRTPPGVRSTARPARTRSPKVNPPR